MVPTPQCITFDLDFEVVEPQGGNVELIVEEVGRGQFTLQQWQKKNLLADAVENIQGGQVNLALER